MTTDDVVSKIRKMLNLAACTSASEGEIENALRFARNLMDEYNLAEADLYLDQSKAGQTYDSIVEAEACVRNGTVDRLDKHMLHVVCYICGVRHFSRKRVVSGKQQEHLVLFGLPRDVAVAKAMHGQLMVSMRAMSRFACGPGWKKPHWDYCRGFVLRLIERAKEISKPASSSQQSCAIVLAKDSMVHRYSTEKLRLKLGKTRALRINDASMFNRGRADADNVSLSTNGIGRSDRPAAKGLLA